MLKVPRENPVAVKQYGLQRSGTNFTKFVIESNYRVTVLCNVGGWKHGYYRGPANTDLIITTKHPLAWAVSWWRVERPRAEQHPNWRFNNWFQRKGEALCDHWSKRNSHWMNLDVGVNVSTLRYEDLILDPQKEFDQFDWERKSITFIVPDKKMAMGVETTGQTSIPFDADFYLEERYYDWYRPEDILLAAKHLDRELMDRLNYTLGRPNGEALPW